MRQYFSDLSVGDIISMPVVFTAATSRLTKSKKPYLNLEVFDGRNKLEANYWDWAGKHLPEINDAVYTINATVSTYNDRMQLTVKGIVSNNEVPLTDFLPSADVDLQKSFSDAWALATDHIKDDTLRNLTLAALESFKEEWLYVPGAASVHHAYVGGTLVHSLSVANLAKAMIDCVPFANKSLTIAGALLHDIGKLYTYTFEGATSLMTDEGKLLEHAYMGATMIHDIAKSMSLKSSVEIEKIELLKHIVLSHHGSLEFGAVIVPQCIEAYIVSEADNIDAKAEIIRAACANTGNKWTDKIWPLNNRPVLNYKYTKGLECKGDEGAELPFE